MSEILYRHLDHVVAALVLVSRIGDIATTYFVTPTLSLEANPIVRRLGWKFALVTLLVCLIPYVHLGGGLAVGVASLLVSSRNASSIWMARGLGEQSLRDLYRSLATRTRLRQAIVPTAVSGAFASLAGIAVMYFSEDLESLSSWAGFGVVMYGLVIALHHSLFYRRLYRGVRVSRAP